jgi:hypothetical protein
MAFLKHYFPQLFLISSLVLLAFTATEYFDSSKRKVKAVPLIQLRSLDRTAIVDIDGHMIAILGVKKGSKKSMPKVWFKNMRSHKIKSYRVGQRLFGTKIRLAGVDNKNVELRGKTGTHRLILRKQ